MKLNSILITCENRAKIGDQIKIRAHKKLDLAVRYQDELHKGGLAGIVVSSPASKKWGKGDFSVTSAKFAKFPIKRRSVWSTGKC